MPQGARNYRSEQESIVRKVKGNISADSTEDLLLSLPSTDQSQRGDHASRSLDEVFIFTDSAEDFLS